MLNFKVIGAGAAGNKAAIDLIASEFNPKDVILINSTSKDINENFKENSIIFGKASGFLGGCGKERTLGKRLIIADMKAGMINLDTIVDPDTNAVVIVSSTEGGSGSAVTPILAKYFKEVVGIPVIVVLFFGFNSDVRGMQNSIEILQELSEEYTIIGICNEKFKTDGVNKLNAEAAANQKFVDIIHILSGKNIHPSNQNIDDTDLLKIVTTPGYMMVEELNISKFKNMDQISKAISTTIDESKLMDCNDPGAKRIGAIYRIQNSLSEFMDFGADDLSTRYGTPYEMFTHIQNDDSNMIEWIISGLPMPIDEVTEIFENYKKHSSIVNKKKDGFFDSVSELRGNKEDDMFNMFSSSTKNKSKSSFFSDFDSEGEIEKDEEDKTYGKEY